MSAKVPTALKVAVVPFGIVVLGVDTAIDMRSAFRTVSVVRPWIAPLVALIVVMPGVVVAVARPAAEMVAAAVDDEAQVTIAVRSCVVVAFVIGSLKVPVAVNCCFVPVA